MRGKKHKTRQKTVGVFEGNDDGMEHKGRSS